VKRPWWLEVMVGGAKGAGKNNSRWSARRVRFAHEDDLGTEGTCLRPRCQALAPWTCLCTGRTALQIGASNCTGGAIARRAPVCTLGTWLCTRGKCLLAPRCHAFPPKGEAIARRGAVLARRGHGFPHPGASQPRDMPSANGERS